MISDSFELLWKLREHGYDHAERDSWWWPKSGSFSVVVGAVLTQNTAWERVEHSLENLYMEGLLSPERLGYYPLSSLEALIRPSGFYRAKAMNLRGLSRKIVEQFGNFEEFRREVNREWLLACRGIGPETADAILNYACYREVFVVDSYTARLLEVLGVTPEGYDAIQEWMLEGLTGRTEELYPGLSVAQVYARSHGMIVEYCKRHRKGKSILPASWLLE